MIKTGLVKRIEVGCFSLSPFPKVKEYVGHNAWQYFSLLKKQKGPIVIKQTFKQVTKFNSNVIVCKQRDYLEVSDK